MLGRKPLYGVMILLNDYFRKMEKDFDFDDEKIDAKFILWRLIFWLFMGAFIFFMLEHEKKVNLEIEKKRTLQQDTITTNIK